MSTCNWPLGNGQHLGFNIYSENSNWKKHPGLYIFAYESSNGKWTALYVGQTDDFSQRLPHHEKLNRAVQLGATHIHTLHIPMQYDRDRFEEMLIQNLQPPLNEQLKKAC